MKPMRLVPSLKRMLGTERKQISYSGPTDKIIFAIGDIHGQAIALSRLLDRMIDFAESHPDLSERFVFLGDYIDRGLEVASALDELIAFGSNFDCVFLRGNHDQIFLDFMDDPEPVGEAWVGLGGKETLAGYGIQLPSDRAQRNWHAIREALLNAMPQAHIDFLRSTTLQHEEADYLFVHAGVNPRRPLHDQLDKDLLWIRDEFLHHSEPMDKMVVHGHTPAERPVRTPSRIGIDTGVYLTGVLTAVAIVGEKIAFISSQSPTAQA